MGELFQYGGYVEIERTGDSEGEVMKLPFTFDDPFYLDPTVINDRARQIAEQFLDLLRDTAPAHRDDYGGVVKVIITSIVRMNISE